MMRRFGLGAALLTLVGLLSACYPPGSVIVGTVETADATFAPNIEIAVYADTTATTPTAVTTTNLGGGFSFQADQVPDGTYVIEIGDRWWTGTGLSADATDATTISVSAAGPRVVIDTQIDAAATITGALADPDSTPVTDQLIVVQTPTGDLVTAATTGPDGSFVLQLGVAGDYRLAVYDPESGTFEPIGDPVYTLTRGQVLDLGTLTIGFPTTGAAAVTSGYTHTCATRANGTVSCWGDNTDGQLGDGTTTRSLTPVTVTGITDATSIAAGASHSCAVHRDGTVSCWGDNSYRQLGNGTNTDSLTPVTVTGITDATSVAAGEYHTCATHTTGTVSCWGHNFYGQLGNGTSNTNASTPVDVTGITDATAIAAGEDHTCAVHTDGTLSCWGYNGDGELGNGTTTNASIPVTVSGITDATSIAAGTSHTCATHTDGTVSCWGYNGAGQLGNGTTTKSSTPVTVTGITDATRIAAGTYHTCATHTDGTVSCWGYNSNGELGNGTTDRSSIPGAVIGFP